MQFNGQTIETDAQGYLRHVTDWSEALALVLAEREGIVLEDRPLGSGAVRAGLLPGVQHLPAIRALVKAMEKQYGPEKGNSCYSTSCS